MRCPYCGKKAILKDNKILYGKSYGLSYICLDCDAYVGCHAGTNKPLGTMANRELRGLRCLVHELFDPIWKTNQMRRKEAYKWFAKQLGIDFKNCHIAMFNVSLCKKAITILNKESYGCKSRGED